MPMTTPIIQNFEKILAGGKDNTLLRFSLGSEYLKPGDPVSAANHLKQAVCWRRLNIDPPCRLNIDPGPVAVF